VEKYWVDLILLKTEMKYKGYTDETVLKYSSIVKEFLNYTKKNIEDITEEDFKNYFSYLKIEKKNKKNTLAHKQNALEFFFENVLGLKVTTRLKKIEREVKKKEYLTQDEFEALLKSSSKRNKIMWSLMYYYGLTTRELCELKRNDYDKSNKSLKVFNRMVKIETISLLMNDYIENNNDFEYMFYHNKRKMKNLKLRSEFMNDMNNARITKNINTSNLKYSRAYNLLLENRVKEAIKVLNYKNEEAIWGYFRNENEIIKKNIKKYLKWL
jgi:integrase